ncbi:MAG: DNA-processing protein DprA [Dysgonomonas sp.]
MSDQSKLLYQIALTQIRGVGDITARQLLEVVGDAEEVFRMGKKKLLSIRGISQSLANEILNPEVLRKAEEELCFVEKNKIKTYFFTDSNYPSRLQECLDAPVLLYHKGNADLNAKKIISIVGTRKSTNYGNSFCHNFVEEIGSICPDIVIASGLAYGIDIEAHKAALKNNLSTIGILAHGLDRIYPSTHRKTAVEMLEKGGLLTEFTSGTEPERHNFVRRNRIIAGIADAVIVIESDKKGGSLITAEIANSYNKDVFALPGRTTDLYSSGCNRLIVDNKALLLQSAKSFVDLMNWDISTTKKPQTKQRQLFPDLSVDEQKIYDLLLEAESVHMNALSSRVSIPLSTLFSTLLEMEMKGIIEPMPGGLYCLK